MLFVVILAFLLFPLVGSAAEPVSLKQAVDLALENNHLLKSAVQKRAAASQEVRIARGKFLPRLRLEENLAATDSPSGVFMMKMDQGRFTQKDFDVATLNHPSAYHNFLTFLSLEQPLFDLRTVQEVEAARQRDRSSGFQLELQRQATALTVYEAYLAVRRCGSLLNVAESGLKAAQEHLRLARVRNGSGVGLKSDELRAATYLAEMEQQQITAANDLRLARLRLGQVIGFEPGVPAEVSAQEVRQLPLPEEGKLALLALQHRPELKGLEAEEAGAEAGVQMARAGYFPSLYGSAGYRMNNRDYPFGRDNDGWQAGVSLRWELFDGWQRESGIEKARAEKMAVREMREEMKREVQLQVTEQSLRHGEAEQRLAVARKAYLQAEEGLRLVTRRFENSLATIVELLDAETALQKSRSMVVENEAALQLATARLSAAAGILLQEVGK